MIRFHRRALALASTGVATAAIGLLGVAAPAHADAPSAPAPTTTAARCDAAPWAGRAQGRPAHLSAGSRSGDYLWHDGHGFHVRVTHPQHGRDVYTGVITASAPMRIDPVKLEKGDVVKLSDDRKVLSFAFVNYGSIDGVDFHTDCATSLTVSRLHVGDRDLARDHVYLGEHRSHPEHVPFTVHRKA